MITTSCSGRLTPEVIHSLHDLFPLSLYQQTGTQTACRFSHVNFSPGVNKVLNVSSFLSLHSRHVSSKLSQLSDWSSILRLNLRNVCNNVQKERRAELDLIDGSVAPSCKSSHHAKVSVYFILCGYLFTIVGRDSSIGIAIGYGLDGPGIESQ